MLHTFKKFLQPPPGLQCDFSAPRQAAALAPADGVSWKIFANPIALFIGGVSAVILELAEPHVRTGVWEHSSFRRDPFARLHRTGYAAMVTVYAPRAQAQEMIAKVVRMHQRVQGTTPEGHSYYANDPQLLNWVQATAIFGFTQAFDRYAQPLTRAQKDAAFAEGQASASLYGAQGLPQDWAGWERLLQDTAPSLQAHPILSEFLDIMSNAAIFPAPLRPLQKMLVKAAVDITPQPVRSLKPLQGYLLRGWERTLIRSLGWLAQRLPIPQLPPAQARQRMR